MLKILTLNWNGKDKLLKLYDSLNKYLKVPYEWHIKDNGSSDGSQQLIESWKNQNIGLVKYQHNRDNFSEGVNILYKFCAPKSNDLILLLNNDVILNDEKSIPNMMNIINNDSSVGVVGARLLFTDTNKLQHAGVVFKKSYNLPYHFRLNEEVDDNSKINREFQAITGACFLTKPEYYENICYDNKSKINGLPENLKWAFDDIYACLAIKYNLGKKIVYCGNTNIFHEESATLKKNPVNKLFMTHNINYFRSVWYKKILIDEDLYKNTKYNIYTGK